MSADNEQKFDDTMLVDELVYPDWFKISLGDLSEDVREARNAGKSGIIVYYGQKRCAYCQKFLEVVLGYSEVSSYLRKHFHMIPIDIWGIEEFVDTDGNTYSERELALHYQTNFTPSLVFYDARGRVVYRLRGLYPRYRFRAVLQYVREKFYLVENFREYLERAQPGLFFTSGDLIERDFFLQPPYDLRTQLQTSGKPLVVIFEQGACHSCELLHTGPLSEDEIQRELGKMDVVQLGLFSDTPVVTPAGKMTTSKDWARDLGLFYTPAIIFFSPRGEEVMRLDSVVQFYRLWGVLDYVNKQGYQENSNYQDWRLRRRKQLN